MKRLLCLVALAALLLVPDWASACGRRWGRPTYYTNSYYPGVYRPVAYRPVVYRRIYREPVYQQAYQPVYQPAPQPVVYTQPVYQPVVRPTQQPLQPPRIVVVPPANSNPPRVEPIHPVAQPEPAPAPAGLNNAIPPEMPVAIPKAKPEPVAAPAPHDAAVPPKVPDPKLSLEPPKTGSDSKLPPLTLPLPMGSDKLPPLELGGSNAVPVPAPAPDVLIPPPDLPTPKNPDSLPPLTLPPDTPVAPSPTPRPVEAKSSPLTTPDRGLSVSVFAASGSTTANGLRKIGFYNHTKRDLALTIEGKSVTLPAMSYLHANLPPTFTWKCPDKPAAKETVPADATGLDVVIRE